LPSSISAIREHWSSKPAECAWFKSGQLRRGDEGSFRLALSSNNAGTKNPGGYGTISAIAGSGIESAKIAADKILVARAIEGIPHSIRNWALF
jgi:hypothetical protein